MWLKPYTSVAKITENITTIMLAFVTKIDYFRHLYVFFHAFDDVSITEPISIAELAYREYLLYKDVEKIPLSSVLKLAIMPFLMNWWIVCAPYPSIGPITTLDEGLVSISIPLSNIIRCRYTCNVDAISTISGRICISLHCVAFIPYFFTREEFMA